MRGRNLAERRPARRRRAARTEARRLRLTPSPTVTGRPGLGLAAQDRERDRAVGGGEDGGADRAELAVAERDRVAGGRRRLEPQAAQVAVGLALVVQAGDRLLADVAALGEADRALVDPGLLRGSSPSSSRAPKRGRPDSTRTISAAASLDRLGARVARARRATAATPSAGTIRSTPRSVATARTSTPPSSCWRWACSAPSGRDAGRLGRGRADHRDGSPARRSTSSISTSRPILYIARWRSTRVAGDRLGVDPEVRRRSSRRTRMSACMWPLRSSSAA